MWNCCSRQNAILLGISLLLILALTGRAVTVSFVIEFYEQTSCQGCKKIIIFPDSIVVKSLDVVKNLLDSTITWSFVLHYVIHTQSCVDPLSDWKGWRWSPSQC